MPSQRLQYLFEQYIRGHCTVAEKRELFALALASKNNAEVQELLDGYWELVKGEMRMPDEKAQGIISSVLGNHPKSLTVIHKNLFQQRRWWVAAAIFILLATGSYFLFLNRSDKGDEIAKFAEPTKDVKAPETNRAMITLADGRSISLDSLSSGMLAQQGNMKLVKLADGQIAYQNAGGEIVKELQYNTLTNPRGSKVIDMQLSDGSHVWLNAGSSVTYPVAFAGSERKVEITGEAYFEVIHHSTKPFKVIKDEMEITVLGTHFNVNAYTDENAIKVTLLEGSVKVNNTVIKPGQQAQITSGVKVVSNVNLEEVMAWKKGRFQFEGTGIEEVMRQLARWYDVEVVYQRKPEEHFTGEISREVEASKILKMLEITEAVHFKIEGKKVIVTK